MNGISSEPCKAKPSPLSSETPSVLQFPEITAQSQFCLWEGEFKKSIHQKVMRIEKPETSLTSLIFLLTQLRAWTGLFGNTCTSDIGMGFMYFTRAFFADYISCHTFSLGICSPSFIKEARAAAKEVLRFTGNWQCTNLEENHLPWAARFTSCSAATALHWPGGSWNQLQCEHTKVQDKICSFCYFCDSRLDCNLKRWVRYSSCQIQTP